MAIKEIRKEKLINDFLENSKIDLNTIEYKYISIGFYSSKKINLCYAKLSKPKITYFLVSKDNLLKEVNKTIYYYLKDIKEDTESIKKQLENSISLDLFNRFKDKDYQHLNFLSNSEKDKISYTESFYKNDFIKCIDILKEV